MHSFQLEKENQLLIEIPDADERESLRLVRIAKIQMLEMMITRFPTIMTWSIEENSKPYWNGSKSVLIWIIQHSSKWFQSRPQILGCSTERFFLLFVSIPLRLRVSSAQFRSQLVGPDCYLSARWTRLLPLSFEYDATCNSRCDEGCCGLCHSFSHSSRVQNHNCAHYFHHLPRLYYCESVSIIRPSSACEIFTASARRHRWRHLWLEGRM